MKRKYKYIEVKGNNILVKTPVPYTTVRQRENETIEDACNKEFDLNSACSFLYDCMKLLGISNKTAKEKEFTLNIATGDKIERIAANKSNISPAMYKAIKTYNW